MITTETLQRQADHAVDAAAELTLAIVNIDHAEAAVAKAGMGIAITEQLAASKKILRKTINRLEAHHRRMLRKADRQDIKDKRKSGFQQGPSKPPYRNLTPPITKDLP